MTTMTTNERKLLTNQELLRLRPSSDGSIYAPHVDAEVWIRNSDGTYQDKSIRRAVQVRKSTKVVRHGGRYFQLRYDASRNRIFIGLDTPLGRTHAEPKTA